MQYTMKTKHDTQVLCQEKAQKCNDEMNQHYLYSMLLLCTALMGLVEWVL